MISLHCNWVRVGCHKGVCWHGVVWVATHTCNLHDRVQSDVQPSFQPLFVLLMLVKLSTKYPFDHVDCIHNCMHCAVIYGGWLLCQYVCVCLCVCVCVCVHTCVV